MSGSDEPAKGSAKERARLRAATWYAKNKAKALESCRQYREANAAAIKEQKRLAYLRSREDPEFQARLKAYAENTRESKAAYDRVYRQKNAAKLSALKLVWREANASLIRAVKSSYKARRRTKLASGDGSRLVGEWLARVVKVCVWCQSSCEEDFHIDHFHPLAKGGEHRVANLVISCPACNVRKNSLLPADFCARQGFDLDEVERRRESSAPALCPG